jgi:hypothetical protein
VSPTWSLPPAQSWHLTFWPASNSTETVHRQVEVYAGGLPHLRDQTLESLESGYDLVRSRGKQRDAAVVRLVDVWGVLTLLPGQQRDYTRAEFARDLYLLDSSSVATAKSGRVLRWHASSGTRGSGTLATVAQTGQQQLY